MSLIRRAARKDENAGEIVDALREFGVFVCILSGEGVPDLLWGWQGRWGVMELKNPGGAGCLDKRSGKVYRSAPGKLTEAQERFIEAATLADLPVPVVTSITEAIEAVTANPSAEEGKGSHR